MPSFNMGAVVIFEVSRDSSQSRLFCFWLLNDERMVLVDTCQNKCDHRFPWRIEPETYLTLISQYLRAEFGYGLLHVIIKSVKTGIVA